MYGHIFEGCMKFQWNDQALETSKISKLFFC